MKAFLTLLLGVCVGPALMFAQNVELTPPAAAAPASEIRTRTGEELEKLVAPIALYPDSLIALILPASTSPSDVVLAARFVAANSGVSDFEAQNWDDSIKGLARYPTVLKWMDENLEWTRSLGEAFAEQPADVMNAIQRLRAQAKSQGLLTDTAQQKIIIEEDEICIVPARREVIYVPVYDPGIFWSRRSYPHHRSWLSFSSGFAVGVWLNYDCDWRHRRVWVHDRHPGWAYRPDWRHDRHRSHVVHRGEVWRPDPRRIHPAHRHFDRTSAGIRSGGSVRSDLHDTRYDPRRDGDRDSRRDRSQENSRTDADGRRSYQTRENGGRRPGLAAPAPAISAPLVPPADNVAATTRHRGESTRTAQPRIQRTPEDAPSDASNPRRHERYRGDRQEGRRSNPNTVGASSPPAGETPPVPVPHKVRSHDRERPTSSRIERAQAMPERAAAPPASSDGGGRAERSSAGEPRSSRSEDRQESSRPARENPRADSVMRGSRY